MSDEEPANPLLNVGWQLRGLARSTDIETGRKLRQIAAQAEAIVDRPADPERAEPKILTPDDYEVTRWLAAGELDCGAAERWRLFAATESHLKSRFILYEVVGHAGSRALFVDPDGQPVTVAAEAAPVARGWLRDDGIFLYELPDEVARRQLGSVSDFLFLFMAIEDAANEAQWLVDPNHSWTANYSWRPSEGG